MKDIVIMSGKGGTGKTSIAAALGVVAGANAVTVDCDVDAANLHLLYDPEHREHHDFWSGKTAVIDHDACMGCGICHEKCRFGAISVQEGRYVIDPLGCEGCSVCHYLCEAGAIEMQDVMAGEWFVSRNRFGHWFVHARLGIGQENSGKLVSKVKSEARSLAEREQIPHLIVDGPPGIGCPVISSFSGADHILIVTEATQSGLHDLRRLVDLIDFFKTRASCVINKADLNDEARDGIERFCETRGVEVISAIPYSETFLDALQDGKTIMETDDVPLKKQISDIWNHLKTKETLS